MRDYTTARTIFSILEFIAWAAVVLGLIFALVGATAATGFSGSSAGLMGAVPGLIIAVIGIFAVANIQSSRASVDSAEIAGKSLQISKEQLQLAKETYKARFSTKTAAAKPAVVTVQSGATAPATYSTPAQSVPEPAKPAHTAVSTTTDGTRLEYKGQEILITGQKASIGTLNFASVDAAQRHIDRMEEPARMKPLVAGPDAGSADREIAPAVRNLV